MAACDLEKRKKKCHSVHTHLYQGLLVSLRRFQQRERERKEEGVKEKPGGGEGGSERWECKREKKRYSKGDGGSEARERDGNERQGGPER